MTTKASTTGQALRRLREVAGLTLDQVADRADISAAYLSRVETGKCRPSVQWTAVVTKALSAGMTERAEAESESHLGGAA